MNSRNLFYVRNLQSKFYFQTNQIVKSLFFLENYLFSLTDNTEEGMVVKIKIKWIYDQIEKDNYSNKVTKNFFVFSNSIIKKKVLKMIEIYLQIQDQKRLNNVLKSFNSFNSVFNLIIKKSGSNFISSVHFQFFQYLYINEFKNVNELKQIMLNTSLNINDNFEKVFIKVFFNFYVKKKKKPSKVDYLINLLINFLKKNETKFF